MKPALGDLTVWMNYHCQFSSKREFNFPPRGLFCWLMLMRSKKPTNMYDINSEIINVKFSKIVLNWQLVVLFQLNLSQEQEQAMEVKNESMKSEGNFADFHHQYIFVSNWLFEIPNCLWLKTSSKFHTFYHLWICWLLYSYQYNSLEKSG